MTIALFSIPKEERPKAFLLSFYFFLVIAAFWVQKPLRTSKFVKAIGVENIPWAKLGTAALIIPIMLLYSYLARRVPRERLAVGVAAVFAALALFFWRLFSGAAPDWAHYAYFFYIDIYITVMLAVFWSLANDVTPPEQARRIYGVVGAGGIVGGAVGSAVTGWLLKRTGAAPLMLLCIVIMALIAFIGWTAVKRHEREGSSPAAEPSWSDAWKGASLTLSTPYLACIAGIVLCYEVTSNFVDYQFTAAASAAFAGEAAMGAFLGKLGSATIALSVLVQLVVTSAVLRKWGPRAGVLVLPLLLAAGSALYLALPLFIVAVFMFSSDGVFHYSVNQSSKEALYTPTDAAAKYQAKAFIDMFVFRFGKGVSAVLILLFNAHLKPLGFEVSSLSAAALAFILAWLWMARRAGKRYDELTVASS